jgi:hypothetical protein
MSTAGHGHGGHCSYSIMHGATAMGVGVGRVGTARTGWLCLLHKGEVAALACSLDAFRLPFEFEGKPGLLRGLTSLASPHGEANRRPRPAPWSFLTFFSSCLSTSAPPGGAWRADLKSIYGRNFGVRLLTQIVFLLL